MHIAAASGSLSIIKVSGYLSIVTAKIYSIVMNGVEPI